MRATHALLAKINFESFHNPAQAKLQYESYKRILQECDLEVIEIDIGEKLMLEDLLVACNGVVIIPSLETQKREHLETLMKKINDILIEDLGQIVIPIDNFEAKFRGSDFLFTGHEIFVGITPWTNMKGATEIANIFSDYPCNMLELPADFAPLKRHVTMAGDKVLCLSKEPHAQNILRRLKMQAQYAYTILTVENQQAANCVYVNGTLIHRAVEEVPQDFHVSVCVICKTIKYPRRSACFWALATHDINLTSNCLLFEKKSAKGKEEEQL